MSTKIPILLSFYGISTNDDTLLFGQVTYAPAKDLTFRDYSRRKTFRTLVRLYRTRPFSNEHLTLLFGGQHIKVTTDKHGFFQVKVTSNLSPSVLDEVRCDSNESLTLFPDLYDLKIRHVSASLLVVSDIDDTLLHSHILRKLLKFRTLMFTSVEKRKAVQDMQHILRHLNEQGASSIYLSNSEQNLHPLIYRFLTHNEFPKGPLFLKKLRRLKDVIFNIHFPLKDMHKRQTLIELFSFFKTQRFILMGDNTQKDLSIYLDTAQKYPGRVHSIIIRQVVQQDSDLVLIDKHRKFIDENGIKIFYDDHFPSFPTDVIRPIP